VLIGLGVKTGQTGSVDERLPLNEVQVWYAADATS
jgi:hypothetical protein